MRRVPFLLALSLAFALCLAGCGTAPASGGANPGVQPMASATAAQPSGASPSAPVADYATADNQYRQIQVGLNLPKGVTFPDHMPKTSDRYATEAGIITAQNYWFCAWLGAYLSGQSQEAIREVPKYTRMDAYTKALDSRGRAAVDVAIQGVQKGYGSP
jgi:hypothetical protein